MSQNATAKKIVSLQPDDLIDDEAIYYARLKGEFLKKKKRYKLIDLFAGAGGMTLGFSSAFGHPFESVWANDFNEHAAKTYNENFGAHCIQGDLVKILADPRIKIPQADVVIGGPPCQGFSLLNKNRANDPRKQLWRPYMEVVQRSGASIFVMENVQQLLGSEEYEEIYRYAKSLGFKLVSGKLCAADYGVPQTRHRAFIIGCKHTEPTQFFPPKKTHVKPLKESNILTLGLPDPTQIANPEKWKTTRDAIGDLPKAKDIEIRKLKPPLDLHFGRTPTPLSLQRYRAIPEEGMNRFDLQKRALKLTPKCWIRKKTGGTDLFGRLWWNRPAFTIRTEFFKPEKGRYLHPQEHRPITHREAARFQSFPDSFRFLGSKVEIAKQIGNAVPPLLASRVADSVLAILLSLDKK